MEDAPDMGNAMGGKERSTHVNQVKHIMEEELNNYHGTITMENSVNLFMEIRWYYWKNLN